MSKMKLLSLAAAASIAMMSASYAGGPDHQGMPMAQNMGTGMFLGMNYANFTGATSKVGNYAIMFGYMDPDFSGELGFGYQNEQTPATSSVTGSKYTYNLYQIRGDLGLRHELMNTLYVTYGALGSIGFGAPASSGTSQTPYSCGVYAGLDYQPIQHLLLSFKLAPYNYVYTATQSRLNDVFTDGSLEAAYVFSA